MDSIRLGFVGAGFVGGAGIRAFSGYFPIGGVYDKGKDIGSLKEVVHSSDVIFVAVPTPMRKDGSCDTRIVTEVVSEINSLADRDREIEVVIRSTLPPKQLEALWTLNPNIEILFMPEFLTERTADLDFINSPRFIIGAKSDNYHKIKVVLEKRFPRTPVRVMSLTAASLVKYSTNAFFGIKLSFFNEVYRVAEANGIDPDIVIQEVLQDGRIGRSHFQVPGHDKDYGFGGHCLPKDNRAFSVFSEPHNKMVNAAWEVNNEVRTNRNWEKDIGRAVSDD